MCSLGDNEYHHHYKKARNTETMDLRRRVAAYGKAKRDQGKETLQADSLEGICIDEQTSLKVGEI